MDLPWAVRVFTPYGTTHWGLLVGVIVGSALLVILGRRHRCSSGSRTFSRAFAAVLLAYALTMLVFRLQPSQWDLDSSLPLHISDLAWMVAGYALWTRRKWAFSLTYYWGLTLIPHAMITPAVRAGFPDIYFIDYWVQHALVVWATVYLTWGLGMRPNWRSYATVVAATLGWAVLVFGFNAIAGTNYGFLNAKPPDASVLDLMGDWPWYLAVEVAVALSLWALITWPWTRARGRRDVR